MTRKTSKKADEPLWHSQMRAWRRHRKTTDPRMTQEGVAELLGTTHATINRYENGKQRPKPNMIQAIANLLTWGDTDILCKYPPGTEQERLLEMIRKILPSKPPKKSP